MKIEVLASMIHEANRAYSLSIEQYDHEPWEMTPQIIKHSLIQGIKFLAANPDQTPEQMHENWMRHKIDEGWTYGVEKDLDARTHPCLMPFKDLPDADKKKDTIFHSLAHAFLDELEWDESGGVDIGQSAEPKHIHAKGDVTATLRAN